MKENEVIHLASYICWCVCACVYVHVCVCVCVCVCVLQIVYLTFQEKCNKTEVEMNVGALQPRRFQNEKQNCTDKRGVQRRKGDADIFFVDIYKLVGCFLFLFVCLLVCFGCYLLHSVKQHGKPIS